jgi:hypothetical protein
MQTSHDFSQHVQKNLSRFMSRASLLFLIFTVPVCALSENKPDYNFEVRPILSDNCFACHGPDRENLKGGLRLDLREAATKHA